MEHRLDLDRSIGVQWPTRRPVDVTVVGGGIAGSALATVLARHGLGVPVLERDRADRDKVRGEVFALWRTAELGRLGLADIVTAAGGGYATARPVSGVRRRPVGSPGSSVVVINNLPW